MPLPDCYRCCAAFRPRYKRLVDNIYPVNPQDGLIRANLDKLIFFACSSPEKLDRIGEYLAQRVNRDIYRRRYAFITLSMDAMDQLLVSCHARTLNLYLESYLKTIESLLESDASELKILASQSFFRFANIEEDMPSYHRRYAFFVQSFSQLCHSVHENGEVRSRLRVAGLKGIQGVVRKTCSEDLTESIWNSERMNLIVPSLLFNMQESRSLEGRATPDFDSNLELNDPASIAESCLCEIVKKTSFSNIKIVLQPVLNHLDNHGLWVPNHFAVYAFKRIMYNIPMQLSYTVIELIMGHLEANRDKPNKIKIQINNVLAQAITIATADGAGPSVLMIVNGLLKQLSNSVETSQSSANSEDKEFKDGIIDTLADFAKRCPDFQKNEILVFVMGKIRLDDVDGMNRELQNVLLEAVARVAIDYKASHLNNIFQANLVETLLRVLTAIDVATRLLAHQIVQSLLDRQQNLEKLRKINLVLDDRDLSLTPPVRYDVQFFRKHGKDLLEACEDSLEIPNINVNCIEAIYSTFAVMIVEVSCDETAADMLLAILSLQDVALDNKKLNANIRCSLHAAVLCLFGLLSLVLKLEELQSLTRQIHSTRNQHYQDVLPTKAPASKTHPDNIPAECLLDKVAIAAIFKSVGWESTHSQLTESSQPVRYSYAESSSGGPPTVDASGVALELDTPSGSPQIVKRSPSEDISFATFKKILSEPTERRREAKREKWNELAAFYRTATFAEMVARQESSRHQRTPGTPVYSFKRQHPLEPFECGMSPEEVGSYAIKFPDMFMN